MSDASQHDAAPPGTVGSIDVHLRRGVPLALGIVGIVVGALVLGIGVLILLGPAALFLLGGGGDTEAFAQFATPILTTGAIVAAIGLVLLGTGIVLTVVSARQRRARRAASSTR